MAEDLTPRGAEARMPADSEPLLVSRPASARDNEPHVARFRVAYALLAILLGAAVGAFIVLVGRGGSGSGAAWSGWKPQGDSSQQTQEIATHVGGQYRLPSGKELVAVIPRIPPAIETSAQPVPISHIVYAAGSSQSDISVYNTDNSVEYFLCGIGSTSGRCAIGEGSPTIQRARLLHRESLELALYTFKYVDGVDSVVTLQPPKPGANPTFALYFRKSDFSAELSNPLPQTLSGRAPFTVQDFPVRQQAQIAQLVTPHLFRFSYQQAPDGSALMVLQPPAA